MYGAPEECFSCWCSRSTYSLSITEHDPCNDEVVANEWTRFALNPIECICGDLSLNKSLEKDTHTVLFRTIYTVFNLSNLSHTHTHTTTFIIIPCSLFVFYDNKRIVERRSSRTTSINALVVFTLRTQERQLDWTKLWKRVSRMRLCVCLLFAANCFVSTIQSKFRDDISKTG